VVIHASGPLSMYGQPYKRINAFIWCGHPRVVLRVAANRTEENPNPPSRLGSVGAAGLVDGGRHSVDPGPETPSPPPTRRVGSRALGPRGGGRGAVVTPISRRVRARYFTLGFGWHVRRRMARITSWGAGRGNPWFKMDQFDPRRISNSVIPQESHGVHMHRPL